MSSVRKPFNQMVPRDPESANLMEMLNAKEDQQGPIPSLAGTTNCVLSFRQIIIQTAFTLAMQKILDATVTPVGMLGKKREYSKSLIKDAIAFAGLVEECYEECTKPIKDQE